MIGYYEVRHPRCVLQIS